MKHLKTLLLILVGLSLTACLSISQPTRFTPPGQECRFIRHVIEADTIEYPPTPAASYRGGESEILPPPPPMLFLSGGSLNGSFGAGVLEGWAQKRGGSLPDFEVVTGVSTGALLSLAAYANTPLAARKGYIIDHESEAIDLLVDYNGYSLTVTNYLEALKAGGIADLTPLKRSVHDILHDPEFQMMDKIIEKSRRGGKLYTGVVDLDTGEAVAFDMSDMAVKIGQHPYGSPSRAHFTDCFISAVAASSSVPMAARPIAIDNRLYIDGGARFLVFSDQIGDIVRNQRPVDFRQRAPRKLYMLINGTQDIDVKCNKIDPKLCGPNVDPWTEIGARDDWDLLAVALRSIDILQSQVKEFSADKIQNRTTGFGQLVPLKINEEDRENHYFTFEGETRNCNAWRNVDKQRDGSLQFHKRYMRCMIESGKKAVLRNPDWN